MFEPVPIHLETIYHAAYRQGSHVYDLWFDGSKPIRLDRHTARRTMLRPENWLTVSMRGGRFYNFEALALLTPEHRAEIPASSRIPPVAA